MLATSVPATGDCVDKTGYLAESVNLELIQTTTLAGQNKSRFAVIAAPDALCSILDRSRHHEFSYL